MEIDRNMWETTGKTIVKTVNLRSVEFLILTSLGWYQGDYLCTFTSSECGMFCTKSRIGRDRNAWANHP